VSFAEWKLAYRPIDNPATGAKSFAVSGAERDLVLIHDFVYIWSLIEIEDRLELTAGISFINPLEYFVGEIPWDGGRIPANVPYSD
jgi:hypothetical protein